MTLDVLLRGSYDWLAGHQLELALGLGLVYPLLATLLSLIGRGGRTDRDGKLMASLFLGGAMVALVTAVIGLWVALSVYGVSPLQVQLELLVGPVSCFALTLIGVKLVFPLNQLATMRTAGDLALLALLCGGLIWLFSNFRGWGIIFFSGVMQLVVLLSVVGYFIVRVFRRAFGLGQGR